MSQSVIDVIDRVACGNSLEQLSDLNNLRPKVLNLSTVVTSQQREIDELKGSVSFLMSALGWEPKTINSSDPKNEESTVDDN